VARGESSRGQKSTRRMPPGAGARDAMVPAALARDVAGPASRPARSGRCAMMAHFGRPLRFSLSQRGRRCTEIGGSSGTSGSDSWRRVGQHLGRATLRPSELFEGRDPAEIDPHVVNWSRAGRIPEGGADAVGQDASTQTVHAKSRRPVAEDQGGQTAGGGEDIADPDEETVGDFLDRELRPALRPGELKMAL
jgi:hypothetical protein